MGGKGIEGLVGEEEDFVGDAGLDQEPVKVEVMCCQGLVQVSYPGS